DRGSHVERPVTVYKIKDLTDAPKSVKGPYFLCRMSRLMAKKGVSMKLKTLALSILSVVLSVVFPGCGVVGQKTDSGMSVTKPAVAGEILVPNKPKKNVKLDIGNGQCTAEYEELPDGKLKKGSLNILTGACTTPPETDSLTIGGKKVLDI